MKTTVVGASGYTGGELLRILSQHPRVDEIEATSRQHLGKKVSELHPELPTDLEFTNLDTSKANESDIVFLCVPHTKAMEVAPDLTTKVVDLSADYRLKDKKTYEEYYKVKHKNPELLDEAVYGLPELHRKEIAKARLVANPGCYAANIILALYPLAKKLSPKDIVVDSFSGYSGAGRSKVEGGSFYTVKDNLVAYNVVGHRHTPEIIQELGMQVSFVPHILPIWRGMHSTIHAKVKASADEAFKAANDLYKNEPFTHATKDIPQVLSVEKTNDCIIGGFAKDNDTLIYFSVTDNLGKGAAGQATQNMNIMMKYDEKEGLGNKPAHP